MLSFLIILICVIYLYLENNTERIINVSINPLWIKIWRKFYDYTKVSSFSIVFDWEDAILIRINLLVRGFKNLDLKIDNLIAYDLKEILPNYIIQWKSIKLTIIERLIRFLKI